MKVAITSAGNNQQALLDQRFGHCSFFVVYDTENQGIEFIPNPYKNLIENAGKQAVELLAVKKVEKVISGEFGVKIKPLMDSLKMQMIILKKPNYSIADIIQLINQIP
jgi:predicted Fe-Mo cluster-binding NifX family protein